MKDTPKPVEPRKCQHGWKKDTADPTTIPYWNCTYCGAVGFFDPNQFGLLVPRES